MIKYYKSYDMYINSTFKKRFYSKNKAINLAQIMGYNLFKQNHVQIVDTETGEVIFNT